MDLENGLRIRSLKAAPETGRQKKSPAAPWFNYPRKSVFHVLRSDLAGSDPLMLFEIADEKRNR